VIPPAGIDSQYGTLIHELSPEKANTDDWAYGEPACKNLAQNDPDKAIQNADSHQFYAEYWPYVGAPKAVYGALLVMLILAFYEARRRGALRWLRMT
jgi:hypothetical protein